MFVNSYGTQAARWEVSAKGGLYGLDGKTKAIDQLQEFDAELAAFLIEIENYDIEASALSDLRTTLKEMLVTTRTLWRGIERSLLSSDNQTFLALLMDERLQRASQLNVDLGKDLAAGRIRTDLQGLSTYVRVLNQTMEQLDLIFDSRKAGVRRDAG